MTKILKNLLLFFSITVAVIYFTSCVKNSFIIEAVAPPDRPISYYDEIQPIWNAKCVSCHGGGTAPDLRQANSYKALTDGGYVTPLSEDSKLYKSLFTTVHIGRTSPDENAIILGWLLQGALEEIVEYGFFQGALEQIAEEN